MIKLICSHAHIGQIMYLLVAAKLPALKWINFNFCYWQLKNHLHNLNSLDKHRLLEVIIDRWFKMNWLTVWNFSLLLTNSTMFLLNWYRVPLHAFAMYWTHLQKFINSWHSILPNYSGKFCHIPISFYPKMPSMQYIIIVGGTDDACGHSQLLKIKWNWLYLLVLSISFNWGKERFWWNLYFWLVSCPPFW